MQKRRLAAARRADNSNKFSLTHAEADVLQRLYTIFFFTIGFTDLCQLQDFHEEAPPFPDLFLA